MRETLVSIKAVLHSFLFRKAPKAAYGRWFLFLVLLFTSSFSNASKDSLFRDLGFSEIHDTSFLSRHDFSLFEIHSKAWEGKNMELSDILASQAGIQTYKQGGMGSFQSISIRGIAATGILICLDGVPLENASGGSVDLGYIDLSQIEKIEVYKGYIPAKFGGNGMGGVINFISKATNQTQGFFSAGYGNFNTQNISGFISFPLTDSIHANTSLSFRHSDNDFRFLNRNGTEYNTEDDRWEERKNAEFSQVSGNHSFEKIHSNRMLSRLTLAHSMENGGNPGKESNQTVVAGFQRNFVQGIYFLDFPLGKRLSLSSKVTGRFEKSISHSYYPLDKIGYPYPDYLEYGVFQTSLYPEISLDIHPGKSWKGNFYLRGFWDHLEPRDNQKVASPLKWELQRFSGEFAGDFSKSFTSFMIWNTDLSARIIQDQFSGGLLQTPTSQDTLAEQKSLHFFPSGRSALEFFFSSIIQGFISTAYYERAPQVMERYGVYQNILPNPNLKAESGWNYELGIRLKTSSEKHALQVSLFETRLKNGIVWYTTNSYSKPINLSRTQTQGIELNFLTRPVSFFEGNIQGTLQNPKDLSQSSSVYYKKQLVGEPFYSFSFQMQWILPLHLEWSWKTQWRSTVYNDRANVQKIPAAFLHFSDIVWKPFVHSKFSISVQNLLNKTYQNIYSAYPVPGRQFFISWTQNF